MIDIRILITGSRDWEDYGAIVRAISLAMEDLMKKFPDDNEIVIVHGACKTGADAMANEFGNKLSKSFSAPRTKTNKAYSVRVEGHEANWDKYGKAAGPIRNKHMVSLGANVCLEFNLNNSRGTSNCVQFAKEAGIEIISDRRTSPWARRS